MHAMASNERTYIEHESHAIMRSLDKVQTKYEKRAGKNRASYSILYIRLTSKHASNRHTRIVAHGQMCDDEKQADTHTRDHARPANMKASV